MKHDILANFQDRRIEIVGVFDKLTLVWKVDRNIHTVLLQDSFAHVEGAHFDLGHVWIQYADEFKALKVRPGERVRCTCRVTEYKKRLDMPNEQGFMTELKYSLRYPLELVVLNRATSQPEPPVQVPSETLPSEVAVSAAELIVEVRRVAKLAGGFDSLQQLVDVLR